MDSLFTFLHYFLTLYIICVFAWALISWLPMVSPQLAFNSTVLSIRKFLDSIVDPYVRLFRFVPPVRIGAMMLDLSAMVAIFVLILFGHPIINVIGNAFGVH
jgi:uncharacterized protein YggT (Ycf19 family)